MPLGPLPPPSGQVCHQGTANGQLGPTMVPVTAAVSQPLRDAAVAATSQPFRNVAVAATSQPLREAAEMIRPNLLRPQDSQEFGSGIANGGLSGPRTPQPQPTVRINTLSCSSLM